jgi:hypothetical protein
LMCSKSNIKVELKFLNQNLIVRFRTNPTLKLFIINHLNPTKEAIII